jgi:hypothetical protein
VAKELTLRQQKFVSLYCGGKPPREAAIEAGFSASSADAQARALLQGNPKVKAAVEERQAKAPEPGEMAVYGIKECTADIADCKALAIKTNSPMGYAKCVELEMKLHGLLDTSKGGAVAAFQIIIAGLAPPPGPGSGNTPGDIEAFNPAPHRANS